MHIHLEPTHEHLTTIQFLVASPAFCRYSIYFLHCAPPIPTTIISTNTNTKKIKHWLHHHWSNQLYAPSPPESCPPATDAPQITPMLRPPHIFSTDMTNTQIGTTRLGHRHYIKAKKIKPRLFQLHFADIQSIFGIVPHPSPSPSSEQIPTQQKIKQKIFCPHPFFDVYDKNIR